MSFNNPININPALASQTQQLIDAINVLQTDANAQTRNSAVLDAITNAIAEINENQTLLENLASVEGQVDSSATAVNNHTTTKIAEVLTEIGNIDLSNLDEAISSRASATQVNDAIANSRRRKSTQYLEFSIVASTNGAKEQTLPVSPFDIERYELRPVSVRYFFDREYNEQESGVISVAPVDNQNIKLDWLVILSGGDARVKATFELVEYY